MRQQAGYLKAIKLLFAPPQVRLVVVPLPNCGILPIVCEIHIIGLLVAPQGARVLSLAHNAIDG